MNLIETLQERITESEARLAALRRALDIATSEGSSFEALCASLRASGRGWFALYQSSFHDGPGGVEEPLYWLNPYDQHLYNSGYFTLNDLGRWLNDAGPIVKLQIGK